MQFRFSLKSELRLWVKNVCRAIYALESPKLTEEADSQSLLLYIYFFFHFILQSSIYSYRNIKKSVKNVKQIIQ